MTLNRLGWQSSSTGVWRMQSTIDRQLTSIDTVAMSSDNGTLISGSVEEFFGLDSVCSSPGYSREESLVSSDSAIDCDSDADLAVSPLPLVRGRSSLDLSDDHIFCFIKSYVSASGSSTVAIDNKIEQAMDLVKSHLMFAVREEVEVLKERIAELLDRIAFLENENSLLRAAASPETLSELNHLENTYRVSSSSTTSSNNGGVSSTSSLGPANNGNL